MQEVFEKIIEKLEVEEVQAYAKTDGGATYKAFRNAIDIVEQAAAEYNNGWIPCSEPPEAGVYVLLSFENFSVPIVGRYEEDKNGGAYYIGDDSEPCVTQDIFVNAWQPLPAAYHLPACANTDCPYNSDSGCPAVECGCGGFEEGE